MQQNRTLNKIGSRTKRAVTIYWATRTAQQQKQKKSGRVDQGLRSAVTGGAQMDGFIQLFTDLITDCGLPSKFIHRMKAVELPGFFRPTKEWDLLVVKDGTLIAAIEAKSQVGPSFGNNFNNRTEEGCRCVRRMVVRTPSARSEVNLKHKGKGGDCDGDGRR